MTLTRIGWPVAALIASLALAGCQSEEPYRSGPIASQPQGVEGDWMSTDGIAISRFTGGGTFETVATDTGNRLAQGTHRYRDQSTIDIELTSLIRNTQSTVACAMVSMSQLNCTSSTGQQFVLSRRGRA